MSIPILYVKFGKIVVGTYNEFSYKYWVAVVRYTAPAVVCVAKTVLLLVPSASTRYTLK
jgi:hypothetical protein